MTRGRDKIPRTDYAGPVARSPLMERREIVGNRTSEWSREPMAAAHRLGHARQVNTTSRAPGSICVGCLGSRKCWICLGQGRSERPDGGFAPCSRCQGTGSCSLCRPLPDVTVAPPHLPGEASDTVLRLDGGSPLRLDPIEDATLGSPSSACLG